MKATEKYEHIGAGGILFTAQNDSVKTVSYDEYLTTRTGKTSLVVFSVKDSDLRWRKESADEILSEFERFINESGLIEFLKKTENKFEFIIQTKDRAEYKYRDMIIMYGKQLRGKYNKWIDEMLANEKKVS